MLLASYAAQTAFGEHASPQVAGFWLRGETLANLALLSQPVGPPMLQVRSSVMAVRRAVSRLCERRQHATKFKQAELQDANYPGRVCGAGSSCPPACSSSASMADACVKCRCI